MPKNTTTAPGLVKCRESIIIAVDAKPVEWHHRIVRDRRTGQLREIPIHELGPKVPEEQGRVYVFARGEEVHADHEAVLAKPGAFYPVEK